jgi:hypothetical protein
MIQQLHVNSHWRQYRFYLCSAALFLKTFATALMLTFSMMVEAYNAPADVHHLTSDKFTGVHQLLSGMCMAE